MYGKLVLFLCVATLTNAAPKPQWQAQGGYAPPAYAAVPYTSQAVPHATYGPVASYPGTPVLTKAYTGPTVTAYPTSKGAAPYTASPGTNNQAYTAVQYTAGPVAASKGAAPAVSYSYTTPAVQHSSAPMYGAAYSAPPATTYQSVQAYPAGYSGQVAYSGAAGFPGVSGYPGAAPYTVPQYPGAAGFSAGGYPGYPGAAAYSTPHYAAPAGYPHAQAYTGAPAYTPGYPGYPAPVHYSQAPSVSSVNYNGLDGRYSW